MEAGSRKMDLQEEEAKFRRSKAHNAREDNACMCVEPAAAPDLLLLSLSLSLSLDQTSLSFSAYLSWWEVVQCGIYEGKETPRIHREWDA